MSGRVAIVGGGVAGAGAACLLGPRAVLVEREAGPHHKVCGEFVSWEAAAMLARLGVDLAALGGAPVRAVRLVHGGRVARDALPGIGYGLSRQVLDEALLARAAASGAELRRGIAARQLGPAGVGLEGGEVLPAARILLATGKHDLRGVRRAGRASALVGLKQHLRLAPAQAEALAGHVEVVLFPDGYAGLQPIEGGLANLCLVIQRRTFAAAGASWAGLRAWLDGAAPHLAARLRDADPAMERPATIFRVPYGFVHRPSPEDMPGLYRLGDQVGVIPSFTGDGMAIALRSAEEAVRADDPAAYHRRMRALLRRQVGRAMLVHRAGLAAPGVVAALARTWPGVMGGIARATRVADAARG